MARSDKPKATPADGDSVDRVKHLVDESDRAFLGVVRALGKATRWTGAQIGRVPSMMRWGSLRSASGFRNRLVKLLRTEISRAEPDLPAVQLERLADRLVAVIELVLSGAAAIDDIQVLRPTRALVAPAAGAEPPPVAFDELTLIRAAMLRGIFEENLALQYSRTD